MSLYSPLAAYSAPNYVIIVVAIVFFAVFAEKRGAISNGPLAYFSILIWIFIVNYSFGHERNTPWLFNHIAFSIFAYIVSHIYLKSTKIERINALKAIGKINDVICLAVLAYVAILVFFIAGDLSSIITDSNWNGLLFVGTQELGMPKAQLSVITAYSLIWVALTRNVSKLLAYSAFVLVVLLAGRSVVLGLAGALFYHWIRRYPSFAVKASVVVIGFFMLAIALVLIPADALYYDRVANFMVSLDMANENLFGHGNGTYHLYVERNQEELNNQYSYLFSKYQVEVFLSPESMINHIIGSFGYILGSIFFVLQGWSLWWAHKLYSKVQLTERFFFLFWFSSAIAGVGQPQIFFGFPYFFVWALVVSIIFKERQHARTLAAGNSF